MNIGYHLIIRRQFSPFISHRQQYDSLVLLSL